MTSRLAPIADPKVALGVLAPDDVRRLHAATLEVIETVGVRFPSTRALDIWAAHGATVDRETFIVRAPGELIERAIASAPAEYTLAARDPAQDLPLDGRHVYAGTDGCGVEVQDLETGEIRRSALADVAAMPAVPRHLPPGPARCSTCARRRR